MNYWIFTHRNENAELNFERLLQHKNWQFNASPRLQKWIPRIKIGDVIIFYLSDTDKKFKYFSGEAVISSELRNPTRESLGERKKQDFEISFDSIELWGAKKVFLKDVSQKLEFILRAPNPGLAFKDASIIPIHKKDYLIIKQHI